jgi:hypothetical protein
VGLRGSGVMSSLGSYEVEKYLSILEECGDAVGDGVRDVRCTGFVDGGVS